MSGAFLLVTQCPKSSENQGFQGCRRVNGGLKPPKASHGPAYSGTTCGAKIYRKNEQPMNLSELPDTMDAIYFVAPTALARTERSAYVCTTIVALNMGQVWAIRDICRMGGRSNLCRFGDRYSLSSCVSLSVLPRYIVPRGIVCSYKKLSPLSAPRCG